ncbi:MAG: hypothetical protein JWQ01_4844 [Massilia sp.]|nr:hypothetical protein [Massilia sp.]
MTTQLPPTRATPRPETAYDRITKRVIDPVVIRDAERGGVWREAQKVAAK